MVALPRGHSPGCGDVDTSAKRPEGPAVTRPEKHEGAVPERTAPSTGVREVSAGSDGVDPALLDVLGARPLLVHDQPEDDRENARGEKDPPERGVLDEADVVVDD